MTASTANPKQARPRDQWTVTPVQAVLGRRVGFRNHWLYWAVGLSLMFVVGLAQGIKIGRHRRQSR
jgi:hypothetical protein